MWPVNPSRRIAVTVDGTVAAARDDLDEHGVASARVEPEHVHGERQVVRRERRARHREPVHARPGVLRVEVEGARGQVPAGRVDRVRRTGACTEREETGDVRQFAHRDAVHEVLAPAIDRVLDLEHVVAVGRDVVRQHRVGLEPEVVVVRDFLSVRIVERERGLAPARHGIGEIRHELARGDGEAACIGPPAIRPANGRLDTSKLGPMRP
jgi:hypothetical protein